MTTNEYYSYSCFNVKHWNIIYEELIATQNRDDFGNNQTITYADVHRKTDFHDHARISK